ncbi:MAG: TonB-dependent receptor [Pseudomonadota bacterium]
MTSRDLTVLFAAGILSAAFLAAPAAGAEEGEDAVEIYEEVLVLGSREEARLIPGSGALIDTDQLERFDAVDLHQILAAVPGIYVREEDGFGLRPNIGIRGATSDRSQKITMMEDGVLIGPAPYSAPAAYYVPNAARIHALEVLKGPAAIRHGPHTVGGALNFVTRPLPSERVAEIEASAGNQGFLKFGGAYGDSVGQFGYLLDGLHYSSDGFKDQDGGGPTGFERNDVNLKLGWRSDDARAQQLTLKLGFADEDADETYLGLTDFDFSEDPNRRYRAAALDRFQSEHYQAHLNYALSLNESLSLNAKAYYNEYDREWNKFDGLLSGTDVRNVLRFPDRFVDEYLVLTGQIDSDGSDALGIDITNNDRNYKVYGLQVTGLYDFSTGDIDHALTVGVRVHHDEVNRDHRRAGYLMIDGELVFDGVQRGSKVRNHGETDAIAVFVEDQVQIGPVRLTLGGRFEDIDGRLDNFLSGTRSDSSQTNFSPGAGVFWQVTDRIGLLAGINRGFSPAGPGSGDVDPEESLNYEYGARYTSDWLTADVVGFFSDYDNLLGRCRASDSGCNVGEEFNGGNVEIAGVEASFAATRALNDALTATLSGNYTYTESAFQQSFLSQFSQWGLVRRGDELPYLPEHIGRLEFALAHARFEASAALKYQSAMREEPGADSVSDGLQTEAFLTLDLAGTWYVNERLDLQVVVQNVTDEAAIVSHRPFAARPNRPRAAFGRVRLRL